MDVFTKIMDLFGGGIVGSITDAIKSYFPPSMSEQEKATLTMAVEKAQMENALQLAAKANEADKEFNALIKDMEGTAGDLKTIPLIGPILIFLRGAQRPVWGFATLYFDFQVFTGAIPATSGTVQATIITIINVLVLGFLFSERAIKNVMPLITQLFGGKAGTEK